MLRNIIAGLAVVALSASATAQTQLPVHKAVQPKFVGTYKVASGEFVPTSQSRSGPAVLFNNMVASNYYSVPGANQEWIDDGGLKDRAPCDVDQINGFDFIYCSSDPSATGTIAITVYDDNVICSGPVGWPTFNCGYAISGLPMGTPSAALQCWIVGVDLAGGFECPSNLSQPSLRTESSVARLMGWGFIPFLNNTGPWLRDGGYRIDNSFTWFDTVTSVFNGCYWFGGVPWANFAMRMFGPNSNSIATYPISAEAGDTKILVNTTPVAKGGPVETWQVSNTVAGRSYWLLANTVTGEVSVTGMGGQKFSALVGTSGFLPPTPIGMPGGTLTAQVPSNAPANVHVQALETLGGLAQANVTGASNRLSHCF